MECTAKSSFAEIIRRTGDALAADRATKSVTIVVAQCIFIATVAIAIFRTAAAADSSVSSGTVFINVEAHSIAFSALYFWIIPAVFLSSIIGVSQTEIAIPRILKRLETDLVRSPLLNEDTKLLVKTLNERLDDTQTRIFYGGIYSWQPSAQQCEMSHPPRMVRGPSDSSYDNTRDKMPAEKLRADTIEAAPATEVAKRIQPAPRHSYWTRHHATLPYFIVILGTATGMTVSALVPPDGIDCRHIAQIAILIIWLASAELDILLNRMFPPIPKNHKTLFWCTYVKDLIATCTTMGAVIATQVGLFNRCACYTKWGKTGLALPEMPGIAHILRTRLGREYPAIVFTSIAIELLIVPLAIWLWYVDAMRVFVQRDDGKSNAKWLWRSAQRLRAWTSSLKTGLSRLWGKLRSR